MLSWTVRENLTFYYRTNRIDPKCMKTQTGFYIPISFLILLIFLFFFHGLNKHLSFDSIRDQQQVFANFYQEKPIQTLLIYMLVYIINITLFLPGAVPLTILAGALFGLVTGTILVSLASTTGATLAFLTSRFILRDWVQGRFGSSLKKINKGIEEEGAFYLFNLRLVPLFPFSAVNLIMGLTPMKTGTFFFVSQVGMLAGTIVFVNAGTQLSKIESPESLLSPRLVFAFCLLGVFPIIIKKLLTRISRKPDNWR